MKLFQSVFVRFFIVGLITLGFMVYAYTIMNPEKDETTVLPVYGEKNEDSTDHTVSSFSLIDYHYTFGEILLNLVVNSP